MLKEIHEQPDALRQSLAGRVGRDDRIHVAEIEPIADASCAAITRIELVACGTASYAALVGAAALQRWTGLPARVTVGSEFRYNPPPLDGKTLVIAVTQSGETADTIAPTRLRPRARLPDHRGHEHRRLGDHPRGGRGPLPPGRPGDRGRGEQDVRHPGHDARRPRGRDRHACGDRSTTRPSASS